MARGELVLTVTRIEDSKHGQNTTIVYALEIGGADLDTLKVAEHLIHQEIVIRSQTR